MTSPVPPQPTAGDDTPVANHPGLSPAPAPYDMSGEVTGQPDLPALPQHNWLYIIGGAAVSLLLLGIGIIIGSAVDFSSMTSGKSESPLAVAYQECIPATSPYASLGDDGNSLTLDGQGEESSGLALYEIACVLKELNTPDAVIAKLDATRALDGRQSGEWDNIEASWIYHPDSGVQLILTMADPSK